VSIVEHIVPDLIASGEHQWPWLGVQGGDLTPVPVEAMELPIEKGAYISAVISDGPSAKAGVHGAADTRTVRGRQVDIGGDVITAINGRPSILLTICWFTWLSKPDDEVTLKVFRDGEFIEIKVTLELPRVIRNCYPAFIETFYPDSPG
jgi:S1-C subfamily serine protease